MGKKKKLINNTNIPEHSIDAIARCLLPDIIAHYHSEEMQREFAEWKAQKAAAQAQFNKANKPD